MKSIIILLIIILFAQVSPAQNDTINQIDEHGKRIGYWIKHYSNGNIQYEGYFANNLPVGTLKRYYPNGKIKATLKRHPDSITVKATIYDKSGKPRATGPYVNKKKDGCWSFYTDKHNLILKINYQKDKIHGVASRYYANGIVMENTNWINNQLQGLQILYDAQERKTAEINYFANNMHGTYRVFNKKGIIEINGMYASGLKIGKWQYFKANGELDYELIYVKGKLQNPEIMDSIQQRSFDKYEKNKLILKDPASYLNQPSKYFRN